MAVLINQTYCKPHMGCQRCNGWAVSQLQSLRSPHRSYVFCTKRSTAIACRITPATLPPIVARVCSYRDDVFCKSRFMQNSPRIHYIDVAVHLPRTVLIMTWRYHLFGVYIDLVVSLPPATWVNNLNLPACTAVGTHELPCFCLPLRTPHKL